MKRNIEHNRYNLKSEIIAINSRPIFICEVEHNTDLPLIPLFGLKGPLSFTKLHPGSATAHLSVFVVYINECSVTAHNNTDSRYTSDKTY